MVLCFDSAYMVILDFCIFCWVLKGDMYGIYEGAVEIDAA